MYYIENNQVKSVMMTTENEKELQQKDLFIIHCTYKGLYVVLKWHNLEYYWQAVSKEYKRKKNAYNFITRWAKN